MSHPQDEQVSQDYVALIGNFLDARPNLKQILASAPLALRQVRYLLRDYRAKGGDPGRMPEMVETIANALEEISEPTADHHKRQSDKAAGGNELHFVAELYSESGGGRSYKKAFHGFAVGERAGEVLKALAIKQAKEWGAVAEYDMKEGFPCYWVMDVQRNKKHLFRMSVVQELALPQIS